MTSPDGTDGVPDKFADLGLTYDDVLLLPGYSDLAPDRHRHHHAADPRDQHQGAAGQRRDGHRHRVAGWPSRWPAQGGLGVLHRNLSVEDQAYQVDLVKRTQTGIISNPVTIGPDATLEDLDRICGEYRVSGLPVVDADNRLLGIITNRDLRFTPVAEWATTKVDEVMTPMPLVTGPVGISRDEATRAAAQAQARAAPAGRRGRPARRADHRQGLRQVRAVPRTRRNDAHGRLMVGAAIGYFGDAWQRATTLVEAGRRRARRRHRPRPRRDAARHGAAAQERPGDPPRAGHRRQRRDPRRGPGVRRRRRRRGQGRRRPRLHLHDARGHRRAASPRSPRSTKPPSRPSPPASR